MNIIINNINASLVDINSEHDKRLLKDKITEYLHRVEIVENSIALSLLQQAAKTLKEQKNEFVINNARDSKLNVIFQSMQIFIEKLETKINYSNVTRREFEQNALEKKFLIKKSISNSRIARQIRDFTIIVENKKKKKSL